MVAILEDAIKESKPDIVGVSNLFTYNYPACVKILEVYRNIDKTHLQEDDKAFLIREEIISKPSWYIDLF